MSDKHTAHLHSIVISGHKIDFSPPIVIEEGVDLRITSDGEILLLKSSTIFKASLLP